MLVCIICKNPIPKNKAGIYQNFVEGEWKSAHKECVKKRYLPEELHYIDKKTKESRYWVPGTGRKYVLDPDELTLEVA